MVNFKYFVLPVLVGIIRARAQSSDCTITNANGSLVATNCKSIFLKVVILILLNINLIYEKKK